MATDQQKELVDPKKEVNSQTESFASNLLIEILSLIPKLFAKKKKFIVFNLVILALTIVYLLIFAKPYYQSSALLLPEYGSKSSALSSLSNLAAMAGVKIGETSSIQIYDSIIRSELILEKVIYSKYKTVNFKDSVNLIQYFEVKPDEDIPVELRDRMMFVSLYTSFLEIMMSSNYDNISGVLTIVVTMPESKLSSDVINKLVYFLDDYIRTKRKSFSSEQRFYIEKRLNEVADSLKISEEKLKNFREQNRIVKSAQLILDQDRLTRTFQIFQTVYVDLVKQLELVKVDEIKDTPVLNVREISREPIQKTGPSRTLNLILIMFFSFTFSLIYLLLEENIKKIFFEIKKQIK